MEGARPATTGDIDRLVEMAQQIRAEMADLRGGSLFLAREARREPLADGFRAAVRSGDHLVLVGTIDDTAMGYAVGRREGLDDGRLLGVIEDLYVEEGARGVGVGECLMEGLLVWFRESGVAGIDAYALPGDRQTKNFFESSGFTARLLVMHQKAAPA